MLPLSVFDLLGVSVLVIGMLPIYIFLAIYAFSLINAFFLTRMFPVTVARLPKETSCNTVKLPSIVALRFPRMFPLIVATFPKEASFITTNSSLIVKLLPTYTFSTTKLIPNSIR